MIVVYSILSILGFVVTISSAAAVNTVVERTFPGWGRAMARNLARLADRLEQGPGVYLGEFDAIVDENTSDAGLGFAFGSLKAATISRQGATLRRYETVAADWSRHRASREAGAIVWRLSVAEALARTLVSPIASLVVAWGAFGGSGPALLAVAIVGGLQIRGGLARVVRKAARTSGAAVVEEADGGLFMIVFNCVLVASGAWIVVVSLGLPLLSDPLSASMGGPHWHFAVGLICIVSNAGDAASGFAANRCLR